MKHFIFLCGFNDSRDWKTKIYSLLNDYNITIIVPKLKRKFYTFIPYTGWYYIDDYWEDEEGKNKAMIFLNDLIISIQKKGVNLNNIILGGFSQGGTIALSTIIKYKLTLGGLITFNSWESSKISLKTAEQNMLTSFEKIPRRFARPNVSQNNHVALNNTPVLYIYTYNDPLINNIISEASITLLKQQVNKLEVLKFYNKTHDPPLDYLKIMKKFLLQKLRIE